jgi:hypothetical protein
MPKICIDPAVKKIFIGHTTNIVQIKYILKTIGYAIRKCLML